MPAIKDRLQDDWKAALKAKDKFTANVINKNKKEQKNIEKTDNRVIEEEEVSSILANNFKKSKSVKMKVYEYYYY